MPRCQCADPRCPCCEGKCENAGTESLYRVDMDDATGTLFCADCADDAFGSGLFRSDDADDGYYPSREDL